MVGLLAERKADLGCQHDVVAPSAGERLAHDLLRLTAGVDVGSIDEVDPRIQRAMDDPDRVVMIGVAKGAEHHRAQAQRADRDAGASQGSVVH